MIRIKTGSQQCTLVCWDGTTQLHTSASTRWRSVSGLWAHRRVTADRRRSPEMSRDNLTWKRCCGEVEDLPLKLLVRYRTGTCTFYIKKEKKFLPIAGSEVGGGGKLRLLVPFELCTCSQCHETVSSKVCISGGSCTPNPSHIEKPAALPSPVET